MARNAREAIASYVTDMVALEEHIETALRGQVEDLKDDGTTLVGDLQHIRETCTRHKDALEALAERREQAGQGLAKVMKKAASSVLGAGAAAIDFVRSEKLPKNLRDDYAAVSLACVGYVMLHTTALALDDHEVADLASQHLSAHAQSVMALHDLAPLAVVQMLREEGFTVRDDVLPQVAHNLGDVWQNDDDVQLKTDRSTGATPTAARSGLRQHTAR